MLEEVTTCRRNSSIEAVHSQHTVDTSINSVWEECTSKLFQICPYSLAGSHLHRHWAFPGTTSAHYLLCCYSKYLIEKELVSPQGGTRPTYTVYERLNHIFYHLVVWHWLCKLERHRVQCQDSTLIQDDDIKMNSRPSFPLQLPIHCLRHTYGHTGMCSKQILNLTKNKLMLTRWLLESMQSETQRAN